MKVLKGNEMVKRALNGKTRKAKSCIFKTSKNCVGLPLSYHIMGIKTPNSTLQKKWSLFFFFCL